jgi:Domain of unknown function (DUF4082)/Cadherin-like domain
MDQNHFSRRQFLKRGISLTGGSVALGAIGTASGATTNSIVTENQLPGTAQDTWDLPAIAQYSGFGLGKTGVTHYIEGFADNISVNHGTTINFKINTDSKSYRIDIYRLGYYGGAGARLVNSTTMSAASVQPTPLTNAALGLVDAGNWTTTSSWLVPANAVSGVYIAHLFRLDTSGQNHITFIVRDDGTAHDIVFQTSDPTWHAYNGWGGPSLYGNATNADARAYKVSYNRPFATRDSIGAFAGPQDFLFGAEYPAIRWLEANGYDVCYIAGVDTDRNIGGNQLTARKVFLSVGHDEYWSGNQRTNVEAARAAGVHLAFWSGNEVFWKTRYEASTDPSATAYRTLVCYKETKDNQPIDPLDPPTWTGSWRDPRFSPPADGGRPENALIGQIWTVDSWRADTITIPYPMTTLRFWRNTNVAKTLSGKSASLVQNILGYEWDESPDNGFRPAGLFHLSSTTLAVTQYMIDYGSTDGAYTATHAMSLYRYQSSGSIVFGCGTVFWAWGLDADHDLQLSYTTDSNTVSTGAQTVNASNTPVDLNIQQASVNLFADMGIQPLTLRTSTGLVAATKSTDTTAPVSIINAPGAVQEQQIVTITGTASDTGGIVAGVEVSTDGGATWHPATGTTSWSYSWWPQEVGTFNILSRAVDDSLNLESPGPGISVTVGVGTALSLFNPSAVAPFGGTSAPATAGPSQDPSAVEVGIQFQTSGPGSVTGIRFYKNPWNTGTHVGNLWSATGTLLGSATFKSETALGWQTVMLTTPVALTPGTMYVVSFHSTGGQYSSDDNYFATTRTSGPLKAPATGGNSVFAYGSTSVFPSNSGGTDNYWADVIFAPSGSTGNQNPTAGPNSFVTTTNTTLTIQAATLLANDSDPNGFPLTITGVGSATNGTVSYNTGTQTVTFVPTTGYPSPAYTGPAGFNYTISNGNGGTATGTVSITVSVATSSVFSATSAPVNVTISDTSPVELGMKFQASVTGAAIGVRFYKGPKNVGTHVGNLWSSAGALLSSVTFSSETASGWQQAYFTTAPTLTAGATYTVSYHTSGFYSADANGFTNAITNSPLTAPSSASSGGNGVYVYGSTSAFPSSSFNASNYWVDVIFVASGSLSSQPPVANNDSGFVVAKNGSLGIAASALLANDTDANLYTLTVTGVSNPVNGTVSYNTTSQTVTFTPTANYTGPASFTYSISDGHGGTASANVSLTVSVTSSLFSPTSTPSTVTVSDTSSVELGVKFQTSVAGTITGIRFYKGPQNTSTHTGNLWSSTGALLASAVFSGETASGWQQVNFAAVTLTPGTTYTASYHTNGFYSANANYFATALTNGPLTAPATTNGVYVYGSTSAFPTNSFNATNYWVDVVFNQS